GGSYGFPIVVHGFDQWRKLFTSRQLTALGRFVAATRAARDSMAARDTPPDWIEAIGAYLGCMADRLANQNSTGAMWNTIGEKIEQTFARFALPIHWDYPEGNVLSEMTGGYISALQWVGLVCEHLAKAAVS